MSQIRPTSDPAPLTGGRPRRATVRYRCAPATFGKLYVSSDQDYQNAWVLNLSRTGVGLTVTRTVSPGAFVLVQIRSNDSRQVFELPAHVIHCTPQPQGDWTVGCELINPLSPEDLDRLL